MKPIQPQIAISVRKIGFPETIIEPFFLFRKDIELKAHPAYALAKSGDADAAIALVGDLAWDFVSRVSAMCPPDTIFVAPHAREATGDNAIPQVLASACAVLAHGEVDVDIVQVTRVFHTGADPMERMSLRPEFEGDVSLGQQGAERVARLEVLVVVLPAEHERQQRHEALIRFERAVALLPRCIEAIRP